MTSDAHGTEIRTLAELQEITGQPIAPALAKERDHLVDVHRAWLAASRFLLLATSGRDGTCDVSPKGDPAGFVHVVDDRTVAIPERPGNGRVDGWRNVLENPHVGVILLVPGRNDTLRINGRARLVRDAPYFDELVVKGRRPLLACEVAIDQVYFHCPKAFLRSELWATTSWPAPGALPSTAQLAKRLARPDEPLEKIEEYYGAGYAARLY
ncbi:pyridoxamine 5'-phosphate oxidase family protein [Pseudonocardia sp. ICBG601]|uniref:pyridoxamine 5'-phosphate oxidase family protein n=1 Tax=Pseudonocardia sp. ICBG601 TaxID=2846759 RepID=UPI001CF64B90|nr:pyridoxamine 5'-phosphate oxidase family protein [Pseudonocardia sp. ICBG601]